MSDPKSTLDTNGCTQGYLVDLLEANAKWATRLNDTFPQYFPGGKDMKMPNWILWIGCSDSRVHESDALAALPGTALVHRNIANQVHPNDKSAQSIIGYVVGKLDVQHIVVVGHNHCEGVLYALDNLRETEETKSRYTPHDCPHDNDEQSGNSPDDVIRCWLEPLTQRLRECNIRGNTEEVIQAAVEENVRLQVNNFTNTGLGDFVKRAAKKPVWIHGWVYDFRTGFIRDLDITKVIQ